jgi:hypothetical protein
MFCLNDFHSNLDRDFNLGICALGFFSFAKKEQIILKLI